MTFLQLSREREERNYYQLERDRLSTFWEVSTKQLEESRAECRVKDRELEEAEERHQVQQQQQQQQQKQFKTFCFSLGFRIHTFTSHITLVIVFSLPLHLNFC